MTTPRKGSKEWNAELLKFAQSCSSSKDSRTKRLAEACIFMLGTPDYGPDESSYDEGYAQGAADTTYRLSQKTQLPLLNLTPIPDLDDLAIEGLTDEERDSFLDALEEDHPGIKGQINGEPADMVRVNHEQMTGEKPGKITVT